MRQKSSSGRRLSFINTKRNLCLTLVFLVVSAFGIYSSFKYGVASLQFYSVNNMLEQWHNVDQKSVDQNKADQKSAKQIEQAMLKTKKANILHPSHPLYIDILGQLHEWQALNSNNNDTKDLTLAKTYYLSAIEQRPTWPVTYASLMVVKWRLSEFDDEMIMAIEKAIKFGPKKPEVHLAIIQFGLASYNANHPFYTHVRKVLPEYIELATRNNDTRERVLNIIDSYDAKPASCRWLRGLESKSRFTHLRALDALKCDA